MAANDQENPGQAAAPDGLQPIHRRATFTPAPADAVQQFFAEKQPSSSVPINAPPPNPSTAVTPPPGSQLPQAPQRRSLADEELLSTLDTEALRAGGVLDAIEQLQEQLRLREHEAHEFQRWESSMLAIGTPEALGVVEKTRTTFTDVIPVISNTSGTHAVPDHAVPDHAAPPSVVFDLVEPEPVTEPPHFDEWQADGEFESAGGPAEAFGLHDVGDAAPPVEEFDGTAQLDATLAELREASDAPEEPESQGLFSAESSGAESSGAEPTRPEQRTGGAFRLFWLWFAANSSVLGLIFGGLMLSLGMSLRQAIVAALAGVALSFLPIGLATLASKWNGQPTMVVSRASFGTRGNIVPSVLAVFTRVFWGSVLLWLLASVTAGLLIASGADAGLGAIQLTIVSAAAFFLVALVVAFFGYRLIVKVQLVLSVLSGALIIMLIIVTAPLINLPAALTIADGPWVMVVTGAILVFSFVGLAWSTAGGDLARYQRPESAGAASMLTASFGTALPSFVLIAYGALLTASDPSLAFGFLTDPATTLSGLVPPWFLVPLVVAVAIGLLSSVALSVYSGGFAVLAIAPRLRREPVVLGIGVAVGAVAIVLTVTSADLTTIFRDLATTLAVPTAAWLGIFSAEVMIRNRRFNSRSLLQAGGVYPAVRWYNLAMLVVASVVGYGFTTATAAGLAWQGYLLELIGAPATSELARADLGVLVALAVALLAPIVAGIPAIRRQEAAADPGNDAGVRQSAG